jgi:hypothetical protein
LRGAKVKPFFLSGKLFGKKILTSFPPPKPSVLIMNFAVNAGAKVAPFSACASFLMPFFLAFYQILP